MKIIKNKQCRICKGEDFKEVINFGETPLLVNNLLTDPDGDDPTYPLLVEQCQSCYLVQIRDTVEAHDLYQKQDYLFFSSDMPNLEHYFSKFALDILKYLSPDDLVVEIGSNDGVFLQYLKCKVLGVDPATNVVLRALKKGIPTISGFFDEMTARRIKDEWGQAKLITGFNCIAHIDDLDNLMRGVELLLDPMDGVFVIEVNYWGDMVKNRNYGLIYHDHFSYFTLRDWVNYAPKFGLNVFDAMIPPAQGDISDPEIPAEAFNIRVFMAKNRPCTQRMKDLLEGEDFANYGTVEQYAKDIKTSAKKLGNLIRKLKKQGHTIAGYGASAKAFSIFQLAGINENHIDYFVDDSKAKQNKYAPITHIPIYPRENQKPDYFLITAPNYINVIIGKEQKYIKNGGKFITINSEVI